MPTPMAAGEQRVGERAEDAAHDDQGGEVGRAAVGERAGVVEDVLGEGEADPGQPGVDDPVHHPVQLGPPQPDDQHQEQTLGELLGERRDDDREPELRAGERREDELRRRRRSAPPHCHPRPAPPSDSGSAPAPTGPARRRTRSAAGTTPRRPASRPAAAAGRRPAAAAHRPAAGPDPDRPWRSTVSLERRRRGCSTATAFGSADHGTTVPDKARLLIGSAIRGDGRGMTSL